MPTTHTPSTTRRTVAVTLSPLMCAAALMTLAGPAAALPVGTGHGDDPVIHNVPPAAHFTVSPNPALVNSQPLAVAHAVRVAGRVPAGQFKGADGDLVTFDGSASTDDHAISDYAWDLDGNGTYETRGAAAKIQKKRFYATGTFTVRLRVTDAEGATGVVSHTVVVRHAPHAALTADIPVPLIGQQVTYSAAGSTGDPGIARFDWDLDGNGTFETTSGTTPSTATSYQSSGPRTVAVRVTDTLGSTAVASVKEAVNQAPLAAFTFAPSPAVAGQVVHFDGSSSSDDAAIADYAWDLDGDGTFETDTLAVPTAAMTYATPGTVTARLRVTDDQGVQSTVTHAVLVGPAPVATDTTGPLMTIRTRSARVSRTGVVAIRIACPQTERSCTGRLALRSLRGAHIASLGRSAFRLDGGQSATLRVRLSKANRRLVKRLHTLRSQAAAVATDGAGNTATTTATVTITR